MIGVLWSGCQRDRSSPISNFFRLESNQTSDRHIVGLRTRPKVGLQRNLGSAHDFFTRLLDSFARTLVSRYSPRCRQAKSRASSLRSSRLAISWTFIVHPSRWRHDCYLRLPDEWNLLQLRR